MFELIYLGFKDVLAFKLAGENTNLTGFLEAPVFKDSDQQVVLLPAFEETDGTPVEFSVRFHGETGYQIVRCSAADMNQYTVKEQGKDDLVIRPSGRVGYFIHTVDRGDAKDLIKINMVLVYAFSNGMEPGDPRMTLETALSMIQEHMEEIQNQAAELIEKASEKMRSLQ